MAGGAGRPGQAAPVRVLRQRAADAGPVHLVHRRTRPGGAGPHPRVPRPAGGQPMTAVLQTLCWTAICRLEALLVERGAAALVHGAQVAVFRLHDGRVRAVGNLDPLCGAHVMSRGIVGTRGDRTVVASPMHKQSYDLETGECLDVPGVALPVYRTRVRGGAVEVAIA